MGRPKGDEKYYNQVTLEEKGKWKCNHCKATFSGGYSRIKAHLKPEKGKGIAKCSVYAADKEHHPSNITSTSNNTHQAQAVHHTLQVDERVPSTIDTVDSLSNYPYNIQSITSWEGFTPGYSVDRSNNYNSGPENEIIGDLNQLVCDLSCEEGDIKEQLQWLESRGKKRNRQVDVWLDKLQDLKESAAVYMNNIVDLFGLNKIRQLNEEMRKHKEQKPTVLSNEFVGESFEINVKKMWELVRDDEVFIIGILGMGGVGKTFLASYMEDEIKRKGTFKDVLWVTVSYDCGILKLQDDIAERIGIKLHGNDERDRAKHLSSAMEKKEKSLLILDDVWKYIDLQKVGITAGVNDIKLILTSRLEHVCRQMDCLPNNMIIMEPLCEKEAWELFLLKLGHRGTPATLSVEIQKLAKGVVRKCNCLPLKISVMARTMKGVNDIHRWKHEWDKEEMGEEMKEEVFKVLKRSYDILTEKKMQKCFLYCALFEGIDVIELIMKLVDNGMINGKRSLHKIFDEGNAILDKLKDHSLLWSKFRCLRMHDAVRDMAYHILKLENYNCMAICDKGWRNLLDEQECTADLEFVILRDKCWISEIPEDTSPYCPRLSIFWLNHDQMSRIPESFFTCMNGLASLDLSYCDELTCLPNSVGNLKSLISLQLRGCSQLRNVPSLGELQALSRLDISDTSVVRVPQGLENLINLKWLDLSRNMDLTLVPGSVLPGLTNLQYLDLCCSCSNLATIILEDVKRMSMLEYFGASFHDCQNYNNFVQQFLHGDLGLKDYCLCSGNIDASGVFIETDFTVNECQDIHFGDCKELAHILPSSVRQLSISDNHQWKCLCDTLSCVCYSRMRKIKILRCRELESLFCLSTSCSLCSRILHLESLHLKSLTSLTVIFKEDVTQSMSPTPHKVFSQLTHFYISNCDQVNTLLTAGVVSQLENLQTITVLSCESLEDIFSVSNSDEGSSITLPKLTSLTLKNLPELKTVCKGTICCMFSPTLVYAECPNLERPQFKLFWF